MPLKLIALVLPLSLDTFAVSAAIGVSRLNRGERLRLSLLMAAFEMAMPVLGFVVGSEVGGALGEAANYVAIAVLAAVGVYMLRADNADPKRVSMAARSRGIAAVGLGVSVSVDELAIGLGIGLLRLSPLLVVALIGAQAFVASQLGSRLGNRLGQHVEERAEAAAGAILIGLAAVLLGLTLTGHA